MRMCILKCREWWRVPMTLDEKIRYGMLALGGLTFVFAALGIHATPLEQIRGWGTS